jgi:hypothetical protein
MNAFAQDGYGGISWNIAVPTEDLKDFIDETSFRGFGIEFRSFVTKHISIGGVTGWNIMDQRLDGTFEIQNGAISGTQIRYLNSFPIMLTSHLHLGSPRSAIRPFVGIGVGTYYIVQRLEIGINMLEENNWHFGIAPEVGFLFPTDYVSIMTSLKYNAAFTSGESISKESVAHSYWGINIGILFPTY